MSDCNFGRLLNRAGIFIALILALSASGCSSQPKTPPKPPTTPVFRLLHQAGGTHHRVVSHGEVTYHAFNSSLLVIPAGTMTPLRSIALGSTHTTTRLNESAAIGTGPAVDMLIDSSSPLNLFVVIHDDELVQLSLANPRTPEIVNRTSAHDLGIRPRRLSSMNGEIYVSGPGGIVRIRDNHRLFTTEEDVSRVAKSDTGFIACVGRRVIRLADGKYVGSATDVQMLPLALSASPHTVFVRQGEAGALVGLMTPDVREVDARRATIAVPGTVSSVRWHDERLWIVSDEQIVGLKVSESALTDPIYVNIIGALDVAPAKANYLAICGTFGRLLYRIGRDEAGEGDAFLHVHRDAGRLSQALTDGHRILAGSREGLWMYLINSRAELTSRPFPNVPPPPSTTAGVASGQARFSDDGLRVIIKVNRTDAALTSQAEEITYSEAADCRLHCVVAIDGDLWLGHDRGVTVLRSSTVAVPGGHKDQKKTVWQPVARVRCAGPVLYIYPLLVGSGASFVSEFGGFYVARFEDELVETLKR